MYKICLTFQKLEEIKYISHLDTIRVFERAIRKSKIKVIYSQGFNPRINISFALPAPVGVAGFNEYLELEVEEQTEEQTICNTLNQNLPKGIRIINAKYINNEQKSLMSLVEKAKYEIIIYTKENITQEQTKNIQDLFNQDEIKIIKRTPKKIREVDIKPLILEKTIQCNENTIKINIMSQAGSKENLKAELIIDAIIKNKIIEMEDYNITRKEIILMHN